MQNVKNSLFTKPLLSLAGLCFAIALVSPFIFVEKTTQHAIVAKAATPTLTITSSPTVENEQAVQGQTSYNEPATPTVSTQTTTQTTSQPTVTTAPQATNAPEVKTFQVNLTINGSSVGSVTMPEGSNQCDVLSRAQDQGKISQLLMKYDNSLGTNGVYQINGTGKENSVWWVYKVNGASPTQGCSYIKANSGDTVEWEYKG